MLPALVWVRDFHSFYRLHLSRIVPHEHLCNNFNMRKIHIFKILKKVSRPETRQNEVFRDFWTLFSRDEGFGKNMDKSTLASRSEKLNELKNNQKLEAILALDNRGYCYHNDGFPKKNYQVHTLHQLSQFFFPGKSSSTVITVQGTETITSIQQNSNQDVIAMRVKKAKTETV